MLEVRKRPAITEEAEFVVAFRLYKKFVKFVDNETLFTRQYSIVEFPVKLTVVSCTIKFSNCCVIKLVAL